MLPWTEDYIREMQNTYHSDAAIARAHRRVSPYEVRNIRRKYGIEAYRPDFCERDKAIVRDYQNGMSDSELISTYNLSYHYICRIVWMSGGRVREYVPKYEEEQG